MSPNAAIVEAAFSFLGVPFFNKGSFCVTKGIGGEAFPFACDNKVCGLAEKGDAKCQRYPRTDGDNILSRGSAWLWAQTPFLGMALKKVSSCCRRRSMLASRRADADVIQVRRAGERIKWKENSGGGCCGCKNRDRTKGEAYCTAFSSLGEFILKGRRKPKPL